MWMTQQIRVDQCSKRVVSSKFAQGDECLVAMCSLVKVPAIALMLPAPITDDARKALEKISDAGGLA